MSTDDRGRPDGGDAERDIWLREALRHAPDAEAVPPPALRDSILAQARAAARLAPPASGRRDPATSTSGQSGAGSLADGFAAFWSWLARPPVAAGFASVMAATLVGMLWWDRPIDETLPQAPPFESARPGSGSGRADTEPPASPAPPVAMTEASPEQQRREQSAATSSPRPRPPAAPPQPPAPPAPSAQARSTAPVPAPVPSLPAPSPAPARGAGPGEAEKERGAAKRESSAAFADRDAAKAAETEAADRRAAEAKAAAPSRSLESADAAREERKDRQALGGVAKPDASSRSAPTAPAPGAAPAPAIAQLPAPAPAPQAAPAPTRQAVPAPTTQAGPVPAPFPAERRRDNETDALRAAPAAAPPAAARPEPFALSRKAAPAQDGATANQLAGRAAAPREASGAEPGSLREAATPEPPVATVRPMSRSLSAIASEGGRWTRALPGGVDAGVDAAPRAWLADVQTATGRRWERRGEHRLGGATADANALLLRRDGQPALLVRLEDGGVLFEAGGDAWFAPLPPEALARLRASMPPAPR